MDKPTKNRQTYNTVILIELKNRYGYSLDFIRKSLRGDRVGEMPDILKKEYRTMDNESKKAIKKSLEDLKS